MDQLFKPYENQQAYAKIGLLGFAGSGKSFSSTKIAIGAVKMFKERDLPYADKPIFFLDTETGSDWVEPMIRKEKIPIMVAKSRAFKDLLAAVDEAEKNASILIIDSISHFWKELMDAYLAKKKRERMQFQDWMPLKNQWYEFTDRYVNSFLHVIIAGRAGYEYNYFEDAEGDKQLEKTGIKMKAETEMGYEPSLLILMERHLDLEKKKVSRIGSVLKDRSALLDGKDFKNPKFSDFKPHFDFLALGGIQLGVDTTRTSEDLFDTNGDTKYRREMKLKDICLEEIGEVIKKHYPGSTGDEKKARLAILEKHFGTPSWKRVETLKLDALEKARNDIWLELEAVPYKFEVPESQESSAEDIPI
jgi:hypothetical protein